MNRFIFIILLLISSASWADQLIIEPDMGRAPVLNAIKNTEHTLHLVMYGLTDTEIMQAIIRQSQRNTTNIILEDNPYKAENENINAIKLFKNNHISWQGTIAPFRLIHQKTLIIDGRKAIVMTFNFTHSTFKNERNFALVIDDAKKVNEIESVFSADWNHKTVNTHSPDLIYSPNDSREKLISLIQSANKNIDIYAQNISDYKIIGALAKAARAGVTIKIVTSNKVREKQYRFLKRAGISIHQSKQLYIHAKVFIIDHQLAVIGSTNLTRASLDDNRELSVITHDNAVIEKLLTTFNNDWNETDNSKPRHPIHSITWKSTIHAMKIINKHFKSLM